MTAVMLPWNPRLIVQVDDGADRQADGTSRYGAYLAWHPDWFHDGPDQLLPGPQFAVAAWRTATGPVMSPGYVQIRPDLADITIDVAQDDPGRLLAVIEVPLTHASIIFQLPHRWPDEDRSRLPYRWADWDRDDSDLLADRAFPRRVPPADNRPAVLATARVQIPLPADCIPDTTSACGNDLTSQAKRAVQALALAVNAAGAPAVASLQRRSTT